jgi:hypothetical protein
MLVFAVIQIIDQVVWNALDFLSTLGRYGPGLLGKQDLIVSSKISKIGTKTLSPRDLPDIGKISTGI